MNNLVTLFEAIKKKKFKISPIFEIVIFTIQLYPSIFYHGDEC